MEQPRINNALKEIYEGYHRKGVSDWRTRTAVDKAKHIVDMCGHMELRKIIEIGAGDGAVLHELSRRGFSSSMYALEIAESAVETINNRSLEHLKECRLFDGYTMPYPDKAFDLAIASHVLEHVEHPRLFLREMQRISKKQFIEVPLEYCWQGIMDAGNSCRYGHINYFNPLLLDRLIESCGLSIATKRIVDFSMEFYRGQEGWRGMAKYGIRKILRSCVPRLATSLLIYCYCILCEPSAATHGPEGLTLTLQQGKTP